MPPKLTDHKYLIFDVYGTLIDWETGLFDALQPLLSHFPSATHWSRSDALRAFASAEGLVQARHPSMLYSDILSRAHEVLEERLVAAERESTVGREVDTTEQPTPFSSIDFGNSIKKWVAFGDSAGALRDLSAHFKLIVLSNVDHASFIYTHAYLSEGNPLSSDDLHPSPAYMRPSPNDHPADLWLPQRTPNSKSPFALVMTAQDTQAYKPALEGFLAVLEAIRTEPSLFSSPAHNTITSNQPTINEIKSQTLVVAQSILHDHEPARRLGIRSVWIDRPDAVLRPDDDGINAGWAWRFESLRDMARAVEDEL